MSCNDVQRVVISRWKLLMPLTVDFYIGDKQNSVCVDSDYSDSCCGYVLVKNIDFMLKICCGMCTQCDF